MIIIFAKKLVNDVKQELLSEIEKFRTDNHIKNVIILQSIPETQESITRPILPEPEISIAQQLSDDTQQGLLSELEKLRKEEEMILECIPEMLEAPTKLIPFKLFSLAFLMTILSIIILSSKPEILYYN